MQAKRLMAVLQCRSVAFACTKRSCSEGLKEREGWTQGVHEVNTPAVHSASVVAEVCSEILVLSVGSPGSPGSPGSAAGLSDLERQQEGISQVLI